MVEAMVAGMVLAVAAFGVAQALEFGLNQTGIARQRTAAAALANQQMELARALNYDNVFIKSTDSTGAPISITHDSDPDNPDYWIEAGVQDPPKYDPDGSGPLGYEPMLLEPSEPSLIHYQASKVVGGTTFTVYTYVTWVDSPTDGLGVNDVGHDWNKDGIIDDPNGEDQKRVTVVVTWPNVYGTAVHDLKISSLFSIDSVPYLGSTSAVNQAPSVDCPQSSTYGLTASFTVSANDVDGSVVRYDWDFGDGTTVTDGGAAQTHAYASPGTYSVTNTVFDDKGSTASNVTSGCQSVTVTDPSPTPGGEIPSCSISIANGATYATSTQVTLYLSSTDPDGTVTSMQFSSPTSTNFGAALSYTTNTLYTLPSGDGVKTVYAKFIDNDGNSSAPCSDTITLDTTLPGTPSGFEVKREGAKALLSWAGSATLPPPNGDLAGYQIWRRATTSSTWVQVSCTYTGTTSCTDSTIDNPPTDYEYYVVAIDLAGNLSAQSSHVTV